MAKAPRPGVGKRIEAKEAAKRVRMKVSLSGESWVFNPQNIPFGIEKKVRRACDGRPFFFYIGEDNFGVDSMKVVVWVARMVNGEDDLTIEDVDASWPDDLESFDLDEIEEDEPAAIDLDADPNA